MLLILYKKNMLDLKIKNPLESNFDSTKLNILNSLDANNCLFTPELLTYLLKLNQSSKHNRKIYKNKDGIYLIAFRILNKEKRNLVYNYIYYNDMLYLTLIIYFLIRNYYITENNHEWGKYLVILDNVFLDYINVEKYFYLHTKNKLRYKS
jgi:hypothetical protein